MSDAPYIPTVSPESLAQTKALLDELAPWLALAPMNYDQAVQEFVRDSNTTLDDAALVLVLDRVVIHIVRLASYIENRGSGMEHDACVRVANKVVQDIRCALGYSDVHASDLSF